MSNILWELFEIAVGGAFVTAFWWMFLGTKLFEHIAWWKVYLLCVLLAAVAGFGMEIVQALKKVLE